MAFSVPDFNLTCDIYSGPYTGRSLRLSSPCNLALGRREQQFYQDAADPQIAVASLQMGLLLPAGTDLRDEWQGFPSDVIEVPSGSGRWYGLFAFDDVGKGFPNEYRLAVISKIGQAIGPLEYPGLFWPNPVP